jgi:L-malate glycosyltransferase
MPDSENVKRPLVFVWEKFGPYHMDRCEALAEYFGAKQDIVGIEIASHGDIYRWDPTGPGKNFRKITLFPDVSREVLSTWRYFSTLLVACLRLRAKHIFVCGFELPPIFLTAICLRLLGRNVVIMQDSKFDDKQRTLFKEGIKALFYRPYSAALVGTPRTKSYLEFLGMAPARVFVGYDTLSLDRIRRLAGEEPAPRGVAHADRHFTVIARFVTQKNLGLALEAYAGYRRARPSSRRELHLCGAGELEDALKDRVAQLGIDGVRFRGYLQEEDIAKTLARTLALVLPSIEEPFGLVVNEALALGVPVIVSDNCGARDLLVRQGVNGHVIEPDNVEGLSHLMDLLDRDAGEWTRLALNTQKFLAPADTGLFVSTVETIVAALSRRSLDRAVLDTRRGNDDGVEMTSSAEMRKR